MRSRGVRLRQLTTSLKKTLWKPVLHWSGFSLFGHGNDGWGLSHILSADLLGDIVAAQEKTGAEQECRISDRGMMREPNSN